MNEIITRMAAVVIVLVMMLFIAAGCIDDSGDDEYVSDGTTERTTESAAPLEYVYVPETIYLPDGIGQINLNSIAVSGDRVYIAATVINSYDENTSSYNYHSQLYSMNFDGSDFSKLENYEPPSPPASEATGGSHINAIITDGDGNPWVSESWQFGAYDLPDNFDVRTDKLENYEYIDHGSGITLRKLDPTGAQLLSLDISGVVGGQSHLYIQSFNIDNDGNIYLIVPDLLTSNNMLYVLDSGGNMLFQLKNSYSWTNDRLVRMPDGTVTFLAASGSISDKRRVLRPINLDTKTFGNPIYIPGRSLDANVYTGSDEYELLFSDTDSLYGFNVGTEESVRLLDWHDSGLTADVMENIVVLPDGRIMCSSNTYNMRFSRSMTEFVILSKKPRSEIPEKTVLTLATLNTYGLLGIVAHFNRTNPDYQVVVNDYSEGGSVANGFNRLSTEIIAGKVPDILHLSHLPYDQYARNGILEDLYNYIDSDPEIGRGDFMEGALRAAEINGKLYTVFPSFQVIAFIGHPSIIGTGINWTMDEFKAVIDAHPDADMPIGEWLTKYSFLHSAVLLDMDEYIDWENGTADFDNGRFTSLLEYANMFPFPADLAHSSDNIPELLFPAGRQIIQRLYIYDLFAFPRFEAILGGEIALKGFPTSSNSGIFLETGLDFAIPISAQNKDGAWAFMRSVLDERRQLNSDDFGFPTNKAVFDALLQKIIEDTQHGYTSTVSGEGFFYEIPQEPITGEDVDMLLPLIDAAAKVSGWSADLQLWAIISKEAEKYFSGLVSAQEAARVIQSRVSIFVSEQS